VGTSSRVEPKGGGQDHQEAKAHLGPADDPGRDWGPEKGNAPVEGEKDLPGHPGEEKTRGEGEAGEGSPDYPPQAQPPGQGLSSPPDGTQPRRC
jgi:hypothetical protein